MRIVSLPIRYLVTKLKLWWCSAMNQPSTNVSNLVSIYIKLQDSGEQHQISDLVADIVLADGSNLLKRAHFLSDLIEEIPHFDARGSRDRLRLVVNRSVDFYDISDLLGLIQINHGCHGLDISGCSLSNLKGGRDNIQGLHRDFTRKYPQLGDAHWFSRWPRSALDASGIEAVGTWFVNSDFSGADLSKSNIRDGVLEGAQLNQTDLSNANLDMAMLTGANLDFARLHFVSANGTDFSSSSNTCSLRGTSVLGGNFTSANFHWCDLRELVGLGEKTLFHGARFRGAKLQGVSFEALDSGALKGAELYLASLDRTLLRREHFEGPIYEEIVAARRKQQGEDNDPNKMGSASSWMGYASHTYQSLKANFVGLGRTSDASWAHYKERDTARQADRLKMSEKTRSKDVFHRLVLSEFWRWSAGYGERPGNVIRSSIATIAIFAVIYVLIGRWSGDEFGVRGSFIYSAASFFAMAFNAFDSTSWITQALSVVEAGFGIVFLGLFLWTVSNRVGR